LPGRSSRPREDQLEDFVLDGHETGAPVEAPRRVVVSLDDYSQYSGVLGDRVPLGKGEQQPTDAALLVSRRDEELLDRRGLLRRAQGDVPGGLAVLLRDEDDVLSERGEHFAVIPARLRAEHASCEPKEVEEVLLLDPRRDLDRS
jgi:hypothetical protein